MPFDPLNSAPVDDADEGFNPERSQPGEGYRVSPGTRLTRAQLEAQLLERERASAEADARATRMGAFREPVRQVGRTLTAAARGVLGGAALVEQGAYAIPNMVLGAFGKEPWRGPAAHAIEALSPPELAPESDREGFADLVVEGLAGATSGIGVGRHMARVAVTPGARAVGAELAAAPAAQYGAAVGAAGGAQATRDMDLGPVGQTAVGLAGAAVGGAAGGAGTRFPKPRVTTRSGEPNRDPVALAANAPGIPDAEVRPFGASTEQARRMGFRVLPEQVEAQRLNKLPKGYFGHTAVPGSRLRGFAPPNVRGKAISDNQKRVNEFVAKDLRLDGLPPESGLKMAMGPHNAVFNEAARKQPHTVLDEPLRDAIDALGGVRRLNPLLENSAGVEKLRFRLLETLSGQGALPTQQILTAIREFRSDSSSYFDAFVKSGEPEQQQIARAYREIATELEAAIERQAKDPNLVARIRQARTMLAKIHDTLDVMDGNNADPQRMVKLAATSPLSGYSAEIAEIARNFPDTMRSATGLSLPIQDQPGPIWSAIRTAARIGGTAQGPRLLRDAHQNKYGLEDPTFDPRAPWVEPSEPLPPFVKGGAAVVHPPFIVKGPVPEWVPPDTAPFTARALDAEAALAERLLPSLEEQAARAPAAHWDPNAPPAPTASVETWVPSDTPPYSPQMVDASAALEQALLPDLADMGGAASAGAWAPFDMPQAPVTDAALEQALRDFAPDAPAPKPKPKPKPKAKPKGD